MALHRCLASRFSHALFRCVYRHLADGFASCIVSMMNRLNSGAAKSRKYVLSSISEMCSRHVRVFSMRVRFSVGDHLFSGSGGRIKLDWTLRFLEGSDSMRRSVNRAEELELPTSQNWACKRENRLDAIFDMAYREGPYNKPPNAP